MPTPTVSVAIPVYQGARFLEASLRSVFRQSFRDFDVTIVDDGSTDGSAEIAGKASEKFGGAIPFKVVRNSSRRGLVGNWNRCLELSSGGKYSLLFHQDDLLEPHMLQRSVDALESCPDAGLAYSGYRCMDDHDQDLPPWATSPFAGVSGGAVFIEALLREDFICCPGVVVRREVYERLGAYDSRFAFSADLEMWIRIASSHDVICCPEVGVRYRVHTAQVTEAFRDARRIRAELEHLAAVLVGLRRRRHWYPELWRTVVRANLWMLRKNVSAAPADALWAARILAAYPVDVAAAMRDALLERAGVRRTK